MRSTIRNKNYMLFAFYKRFFSKCLLLLLVINFCVTNLCIGGFAANDDNTIIGTAEVSESGILTVLKNGVAPKIVTRDGKKGWECPANIGSMSMNISDKFLSDIDDGTEVDIEIEYYDQNKVNFYMVYDGEEDTETYESIIYVGNSNTWKKHIYTLDDAYFGNRQNGSDFRLQIIGQSAATISLVIASVKIIKYVSKNPVSILLNTDETGNIFGNTDDKNFYVKYNNKAESEQDFNILYEVVRRSGDVVWSQSNNLSMSAGEEKTETITPDFCIYDIFDFRVTLTDEKKRFKTVKTMEFSYVNSDPDSIKNKNFGFATHCSYWPIDEVFELSQKANVGVLRDSFEWVEIEQSKGKYGYPQCDYFFEKLAASKMDYICLLLYGNSFYTNTNKTIPVTENELMGFANYCTYMANKCVEAGVHKYEVWNEPDQATFNPGKATPAQYADFVNYASEAIRKADEKAVIAALTVCGVDNATHQKFFTDALEGGIAEYMDVFSVHPSAGGGSGDVTERAELLENKFRSQFAKYGKGNIPIWNTEYGWTRQLNTEREQAAFSVRSFIDMWSKGTSDIFCYYDLIDDGVLETDRESSFGLVNNYKSKHRDKKAFRAHQGFLSVANVNYLLADSTPNKILPINDKTNVYIFDSNKFGKNVAAMWTTGETDVVNLNLGTREVTCYDWFGNRTVINSIDGNYTFYVDDVPLYIVGSFENPIKTDTAVVALDSTKISGAVGDTVCIKTHSDSIKNYKVSIDGASNIEVVSTDYINESDAVVTLQMPNYKCEGLRFKVNIENEGKILQSSYITFNIINEISSTIKCSLFQKNSYNRWVLNFDIINMSQSNSVNGYITFNKPANMQKLSRTSIGLIPPGKTAKIEVNMPELLKKGMYNIDYDITLNNGKKYNFTQTLDFTLAPYAAKKPEIDGKMPVGEWASSYAMFLDNPEQVKLMTQYKGLQDLSARVNVMWDEEYFYMGVRVLDDVFHNDQEDSMIWNGDCVQFGIFYGGEGFIAFGAAGTRFTETGLALAKNKNTVYRWSSINDEIPSSVIIDNCESAVMRDGTYTYYELKLPWKELLPSTLSVKSNTYLGFSMLVNDSDGSGRKGWIEYASGIGATKDSSLFTYLKLLDK